MVQGLPFLDALREAFASTGALFTLLYLAGLVLVLRHSQRLGSAARLAAWAYGLLLTGSLFSAASRMRRLMQDVRIVGDDRIYDAGLIYLFVGLNLLTSLAGAVCLLLALLKPRSGCGPV